MEKRRKKIDQLCDHMRKIYDEYQLFLSFACAADEKIKYKSKIDLLNHLLSEARAIKDRG